MPNPYFSYSDSFNRSIYENSFRSHPLDISAHVKGDLTNSYSLNSSGYRSIEFSESAQLVSAGCSFTFGSGVPEHKRWSSLIATSLGKSEHNLGVCAWSAHAIIENIYAYIAKYGAPEVLVCLFPEPSRMPVPTVGGLIESDEGTATGSEIVNVMLDRLEDASYPNKPKYSKRPHKVDDVIPVELPLYFYFKYIKMLEAYCQTLNIKFLWSTWDRNLSEFLETVDHGTENYKFFGLSGYVPMGFSKMSWDVSINGGGMTEDSLEDSKRLYTGCHGQLLSEDGDNFYLGTDRSGLVHWGTHKHAHIAENFLSLLA